jgi:lipid-binding SYLF domain-containing protein
VTGLRTAQDSNGDFTSVTAGAPLGGGGNIAAMRNQNGVVIQMTSTTAGLSLTLSAEGAKISVANWTAPEVGHVSCSAIFLLTRLSANLRGASKWLDELL